MSDGRCPACGFDGWSAHFCPGPPPYKDWTAAPTPTPKMHEPECDMTECFIEKDKPCKGERSCMREGCGFFCVCQKLRACERRVRRTAYEEGEENIRVAQQESYDLALSDADAAIAAATVWPSNWDRALGANAARIAVNNLRKRTT